MNTTVLALLLAVLVTACDQEPIVEPPAPAAASDAVVSAYVADPAPDCGPIKQLAGCEGRRDAAGNYCFAAHNADDSLPLPTGCAVRHAGPVGTDAYVTSDCGTDCSYAN